MEKQAILLKLAQTRLAVNYVLRMRSMEKQAFFWGDPLDDKYYDENGVRTWYGLCAGVPYCKPVVTRIEGSTPETKNTLKVEFPGQPYKTMWFNQDSDKNTNGVGANTYKTMAALTGAGGLVGTGVGFAGGGPPGAFLGGGMGTTVGGIAAWDVAGIKALLSGSYRNNMRNALKAHGYNPDMTYAPK